MRDLVEQGFGKGEGEWGRILKRDLFFFLLDLEVKRARRYQNFLCILMVKLTRYFDSNNGDGLEVCRKLVAALLTDETRETDILGDLEKDKFVAILPYADSSAGNQAKSRFDTLLKDYDLKKNGYEVMIQQICFPKNGTSTSDLIKKALEEEIS
jgi:GGDEF domain-containing protein